MLNTKAFSDCLQRSLGDGVETIIVTSISGDVIGSASTATPGDKAYMEESVLSAVATNVWAAYANNDLSRPQQLAMSDAVAVPESLEVLYTSVGPHTLCVASVGGTALLCLSGKSVEVGMLKIKAAALQRHLDGPLRQVLAH